MIIDVFKPERQITASPYGHILANRNVWSSDSTSLIYDVREVETEFTGDRIERVQVDCREIEVLYRSPQPTFCGVPTFCPIDDRFVFIQGPDHGWGYCAWHRHGMLGQLSQPESFRNLDSRDITTPFTQGALRGGTHLHMFSPCGTKVASTYEDHVLATSNNSDCEKNRRTVAVTWLEKRINVPPSTVHNLDGHFTAVVVDLVDDPRPGSDDLTCAHSEAWIDSQRLAFLGEVTSLTQKRHWEVFSVTLPREITHESDQPMQGTLTTRCGAPTGTRVQRLTYTDQNDRPGVAGPRHWCVASPDERLIGHFRTDASGHAQFHVVSAENGEVIQVTSHPFSATSAFSWHPEGHSVAYIADNSVMQVNVHSGLVSRLTPRATNKDHAPTHHACVFAPDGKSIAYMKPVVGNHGRFDQIFCVEAMTQ